MKQRFVMYSNHSFFRNILLSLFLFFMIFGCFTLAVSTISRQTAEEEKQALEQAIQRDITLCYATEGQYPPNLQYLKENYGLTYDNSRYYVDYQALGANIFPEYTILVKEGVTP